MTPTYTGYGRVAHCFMDVGQTVYEARGGRHEMIVACHVIDDFGNSVQVDRQALRDFMKPRG